MAQSMTVTVIGGGSTYTPELIEGVLRRKRVFPVAEVRLMDIDAGKLQIVGALARRMARSAGTGTRVVLTTSLKQALDGADFVFSQIRVGGMAARVLDEKVPLRLGVIGQETTGPGGFAKALRTVPAMLNVAHHMERLCPEAWLINFTNPSGIVTEALLKHSRVRCLGLCNVPIGWYMEFARMLKARPKDLRFDYLGLNHLSWIRKIFCKGQDVTDQVLDTLIQRGSPEGARLLRLLRMIPNGYLNYYYATERVLERMRKAPKTRGEEVQEIEASLLAKYRDPKLARKPPELSKRGGAFYSEAAVSLSTSVYANLGEVHVVNVRNGNALPELPPNCVIEHSCMVDGEGAHPLPTEPLPPQIRGLLQAVKSYEELAVEAAVTGDRRTAVLALVAHPLVRTVDLAERLVDALLHAHRDYLPQFFPQRRRRAARKVASRRPGGEAR